MQYSFETLPVPQRPNRYMKVPMNPTLQTKQDLQASSILSNSQDILASERKGSKPKLALTAKSNKHNFYHHSSIYNVKEYQDLSNALIYKPQDMKRSLRKLDDSQAKVLVADFKRQVASYLLKRKEPISKNFRKYYTDAKAFSTLKELDAQQALFGVEDAVDRSLRSNKYNYKTESVQDVGMEVLLVDQKGLMGTQMISNERIQARLLNCMKNILDDDKVDYDEKMQLMVKQYEEIVKRIKTHAFKVRIPDNYNVNMSDYNEYYQITERKHIDYFRNNIDDYADEIIHSIQTSSAQMSPIKTSHKSSYQESNSQGNNKQEEYHQQYQLQQPVKKQQQKKQPKPKQSQPQPQRQNQQQQPNQQQEQQRLQQQLLIQEQLQQLALLQQQQQNEEQKQVSSDEAISPGKSRKAKKPKQNLTPAEIEEHKRRRQEMLRIQREIQRIKEENPEFVYQKEDSDSQERYRKSKQVKKQEAQQQSGQFPNFDDSDLDNYDDMDQVEDNNQPDQVEEQDENDGPNVKKATKQYINAQRSRNVNPVDIMPEQQNQRQRRNIGQQQEQTQQQPQQQQQPQTQQQFQQQEQQQTTTQSQQQPPLKQQQSIRTMKPKDQTHSQHGQNAQQQQPQQVSNHQSQTDVVYVKFDKQSSQEKYDKSSQHSIKQSANQSFEVPNDQDQFQQSSQIQQQQQSSKQLKQQQQKPQQQSQQPNQPISGKQKSNQSSQQSQFQQQQSSSNHSKKQSAHESKPAEDVQTIKQQIEEKLRHIEDNLVKAKLGFVEKLLNADCVYNVDIQEYKIADFAVDSVDIKIVGETDEDQSVFKELFAWQKEISSTIPRLRAVNKYLPEEVLPDPIAEDEGKESDSDQ